MSRVTRFFRNPLFGIIGCIIGVVGIILAVYFYGKSTTTKDLTYYVHPARTAVVQAGQASSLKVTVGEESIQTDVSAALVAFWNAGDEPIRKEDVLSPMEIKTDGAAPILEARLRKTSRDIVGLSLDESQLSKGVLRLNWDIMEEGDGAVVQLIYAGDTRNEITARATLIGQKEISHVQYPGSIKSPNEQYTDFQETSRLMGFTMLALILLYMVAQGGKMWLFRGYMDSLGAKMWRGERGEIAFGIG